jgi:hypothetical protein
MPAILAGISFLRLDSQARRDNSMRSDVLEHPGFELINEIEELEAKVAPDGGVLPLSGGHQH